MELFFELCHGVVSLFSTTLCSLLFVENNLDCFAHDRFETNRSIDRCCRAEDKCFPRLNETGTRGICISIRHRFTGLRCSDRWD